MRRLSGIDADMIYGETASNHMHVSAVLLLDPSTAPWGFDFDAWKRLVQGQLAHLPPLRQRLVEVPLGVDRPLWVEDPHFHLERHIRRIALPAPGGRRELATLVGELSSYKLDWSGPLWEMWYIEGLESGHVAVLFRIHHACADGVSGALMLGRVFSTEPEPPPSRPAEPFRAPAERIPSESELFARGLVSMALTPLRAARTLGRTISSLVELVRLREGASGRGVARPFQAPRTSLNAPVTPRRSFACVSLPLAEAKRVKRAFDVTLNDVVLALCAGALRRYLMGRGELPDEPLIAAVPVSVRGPGQLESYGNLVSGMFATLATHEEDPVARLHAVRDGTRGAKQIFASGIEDVVMEWAEVANPGAIALAARVGAWMHLEERMPLLFNLLVSNVPGPPTPLFAGGARLVACYPTGPVLGNVALNLTVISYAGSLEFGLMACPDVVPDVWEIADGIERSLGELSGAASAESADRA